VRLGGADEHVDEHVVEHSPVGGPLTWWAILGSNQ
jgi:hypothetical protein